MLARALVLEVQSSAGMPREPDREKDRRSNMPHSTVNAPAKKNGGGGGFTWGKAAEDDYEPVGLQDVSKVSAGPPAPATDAAAAHQPTVPSRLDSADFPSLGACKATPQEVWPRATPREAGAGRIYYIFGSPVGMSPSPDIHNPGFAKNGFPHTYKRFDSPNIADVMKELRTDRCGGGSVTIPHKETVLKEMDELGDAALSIGAVNTVTKLPNGRFRGDNTDWLGIKNLVEARLAAAPKRRSERLTCLLCGAGGTARAAAYAFQQMGASEVYVYNRTTERAKSLAEEFGFRVCEDMGQIAALPELHVVVNTLPGSTDFTLPEVAAAALRRCRPVVLEASYIPRRTAFLKQAMAAGCVVIEGIEMLYEQGCEQCQIWTGRAAPRSDIAASLCSALFSEASSHPAREKMEPIAEIPQALAEQLGPPRRGAGWGSPALVMTAAAGIAVVAAIAAQRRLKR